MLSDCISEPFHAILARMLDEIDKRLLSALQADAQATAQDLAEVLNLSASQIGRRRQRLEALGLIRGYAARLDAQKLGLSVQAFIQVQMTTHGTEPARGFAAFVARQPQVVSAWTLTGEADYLLRVWTADLAGLNSLIHDEILAHPGVGRVQSQIVMDQLKKDAALPL